MSWDFTVDDLRKELKDLKDKLAVQGVKIGEQESKLLRNEEELKATKENYADAMHKLRKEADLTIELEESLKKRKEELKNEKLTRENVEKALRNAQAEREKEAATAKEAQYFLNQVATDSNGHRAHSERLATEKAKLEAQVRELQGELQRQQMAPPPPPAKSSARPRASSLTNLNKVFSLEKDMEQLRASTSASAIDLQSTKERLSKTQNDLVRVENEKAALQKKLNDSEQKIRELQNDRSEMQSEVDFYRAQNASASREEELMARLEEEESRAALLEQQLSQMSRSSSMKRSVDQLQTRLNDEVSRREAVEARESELVQEREEALNELNDLKENLRILNSSMSQKDARIAELERHERALQEQLVIARSEAGPTPIAFDEEKINDMVNGIARIRAERDELKSHLEFFQMEAHFKVEALEKKLSEQTAGTINESQLHEYQRTISQLTGKLTNGRTLTQKLHTAMSAVLITVQHLHAQNGCLREQYTTIVSAYESSSSRSESELAALRRHLEEQLAERASLGSAVASLQESLQIKTEEIGSLVAEHQVVLANKNDEVASTHIRLSDSSRALEEEKEARTTFEARVQELEVDLGTVRQSLADALEHCERLETRQSSEMTSDANTRSLKKEIENLRDRVMRRTEQIGLQQHDIKRLETNMRLTDERLEEVLSELEMAETAKSAMLEDCSTAREERDQSKKALMQAEHEVEHLSIQVREAEAEAQELKASLSSMEELMVSADAAKSGEISQMIEVIAQRDGRIDALVKDLENSEAALVDAREKLNDLTKELEAAQESTQRSVKEIEKRIQSDNLASSNKLQSQISDLEAISKDLEASKLAHADTERTLSSQVAEYNHALVEIERLTSDLEVTKASNLEHTDGLQSRKKEMEQQVADAIRLSSELQDLKAVLEVTRQALLAKDKELEQKEDEVSRLSAENEAAKAKLDETIRGLQSKEEERAMNSAELQRLASELRLVSAKQQHGTDAIQMNEGEVARANERVSSLEKEKADLLAQLTTFEADSEQRLAESVSLRSELDEERKQHEETIRKLEADVVSLQSEKEEQLKASDSLSADLKARQEETATLLEAMKVELEEKQAMYDTLIDEQRKASESSGDKANTLKKQLDDLTTEMEGLQQSLQDEIVGRAREAASHEEELQNALEKQEALSVVESELRHDNQQCQNQLAEVRASLMTLQDENTTMQSEIDNLSGECHRANLRTQFLEGQLASNGKEVSNLRDEMTRVREALSQSEKSGKTAEMSLLLISQQHERTISSLRTQLKEHEKDAERIQKLQQIVGEMKEQINEKDSLLKSKCAEIEENDDKFIQLLKDKKKLTSKVESLTKKNNNLQNKLSTASAGPSKVSSPPSQPSGYTDSPMESVQAAAPIFVAPTPTPIAAAPVFSSAKPRLSSRPPPQSKTPEQPRRISSGKRRRESTPPLEDIPVTSSLGKKRPLPDDSESGRVSVEARFPDSYQPTASGSSTSSAGSSSSSSSLVHVPSMPPMSELSSTPRQRRPLQSLRTGFTPVRGQAALRPTLSQPSPVRKTPAAQALQASTVISDVTNSPPRAKRVFTAEPGSSEPRAQKPASKGWLGKIRGGGVNPLSRTQHQPNADGRS